MKNNLKEELLTKLFTNEVKHYCMEVVLGLSFGRVNIDFPNFDAIM
jgi:hypothetical protein